MTFGNHRAQAFDLILDLGSGLSSSARAMQRFLTEARWDDGAVIGRLQEYLGPKLAHTQAVWVQGGSDFPKQGVKSVGVARQYCGALGKIANCQAGVFLAHVGPGGRALADKRLYLPEEWTSDADRCAAAARVPADRREYRTKTELALEMLAQAQARGHLSARWVAGDSAFGMSPSFRDGLAAAWECGTCWTLRADMTVWPLGAWPGATRTIRDLGVPGKPRLVDGQRRTMAERSAELPEGGLAGDNGGGGKPRDLGPILFQRPAGPGDQEAEARRGALGHIPAESGR